MKTILLLALALPLGLSQTGLCPLGLSQPARIITYDITPESELYLEGSSNVKDFACLSTQAFQPHQAALARQAPDRVTLTTQLRLPIRALDCGNYGMNRDMQATLQAEAYPYIDIRLLEVRGADALPQTQQQGWLSLRARVAVTIAGVTRTLEVPLQARQLDASTYRFAGSCPIQMTAFGLEPPTALLGLVKVSDDIRIFFDLVIKAVSG